MEKREKIINYQLLKLSYQGNPLEDNAEMPSIDLAPDESHTYDIDMFNPNPYPAIDISVHCDFPHHATILPPVLKPNQTGVIKITVNGYDMWDYPDEKPLSANFTYKFIRRKG